MICDLCVSVFQHCDSIGLRNRKLHPVPCSHIQRKHLRVHLCRTNRLVPHQALQHLQRNTSIQHMHRVGMAESMWGNRNRERHAVGRSGLYSFIQPGANCAVGDSPDARLLHSSGSFVSALQWDFQRGHHHLQLADVLCIGQGNQAMHLTASRDTACRSGRFFSPLFERGQLYERIWRRQRKISPRQRQRFVWHCCK